MRQLLAASFFALCTACSSTGGVTTTHEQHPGRSLPLEEKAFVLAIEKLDKKAIVDELGEPAKADDVRVKGTNKIVASIWHYHYVNTDENGQFFETTELDFIDDKVVQIVFINNDGSEKDEEGQTYEIPKNKPNN